MRTFAKLLTLFAAVGLAACTNDVTEDLATTPDFAGGGSVKTLSVALDGTTRVALGEKTAEGMYPVEWQESDVLRINEGKTSAIAIGEDKSVANFTFAVADTTEYHVVYPYVEGLTAVNAACQPVEFATVQNYTEGSFDTASFPMYGHVAAEEGAPTLSSASLNYLAGVLCLKAKGAGEVLTSITLSVSEGAIAGTFDVDCTSGDLTAHEDASKTMTYMLPEGGITLSETPAVFYIAVPAGDYKTMVAKLNTADVAMSLGVPCTGTKAIKAGAVREFAPVTFVANDTADHAGAIFEISDEASLLKFALLVADNNFTYDSAAVTASFEVSGTAAKAWGPIEGYAKLLEGNGNTITGLSAPLFGTTSATIQNLNLKSRYTVTTDYVFGAFAKVLQGGTLKNCQLVEGSTLVYNNADPLNLAAKDADIFFVGGLVGRGESSVVDGCKNYATVTIEKTASEKVNYNGAISGILGIACCATDNTIVTTVENCENHGKIHWKESNGGTAGVGAWIGGVIGIMQQQSTITSCTNRGELLIEGNHYDPSIGGVVGRMEGGAQASKLDNYGDFNHKAVYVGYCYTGAVIGAFAAATPGTAVKECNNYGAYTIYADTKIYRGHIGGIVGYPNDADGVVEDCTNSGAMNMYGKKHRGNVVFYLGGVIGGGAATVKNCTNLGAVTVKDASGEGSTFAVGGAIGALTGSADGCENNGPVLVENFNYLGYKANDEATACTGQFRVGGIAAYVYNTTTIPTVTNSSNLEKGTITVKNVTCDNINGNVAWTVSGGISYSNGTIKNCHNYADIEAYIADGNVCKGWNSNAYGNRTIQIAGIIGYQPQTNTTYEISNCSNEGNIVATCDLPSILRCGGIAAYNKLPMDGVTNKGDITIYRGQGDTYLGGIVGYQQNNSQTNLTNEGNITLASRTLDNGEEVMYGISYLGGCIGTTERGLDTATNKGVISASGRCDDDISQGGIIGYVNTANDMIIQNLTNEATGTITYTARAKSASRVAGAVGYYTTSASSGYTGMALLEAHNKANVSVNVPVDSLICDDGLWIGGINGRVARGKNASNCTNEGNISLSGSPGYFRLGGCFAEAQTATNNNSNSGDITWVAGVSRGTSYIGGVHGQSGSTAGNAGLINTGNVTCNGQNNHESSHTLIGGVVGYATLTHTNPKNYGNVTVGETLSTKSNLFIGGIIGGMNAANSRNINGGENHGLVVCNGSSDAIIQIGGLLGHGAGRNSGTIVSVINSTNANRIIYRGSKAKELYIGAIAGAIDGSEVEGSPNTASATYSILGNVSDTVVYEHNNGTADSDFYGFCGDPGYHIYE